MTISDEERRWLVVGLAMNKVVARVLRPFIKQGMDAHYKKLDNHCNALSVPCTLKTLTHSQASTDAILKSLKFQNINHNLALHGHSKKLYNCGVLSSVELAKLYLPNHLSTFAAFDETLDMSAILRLLVSHSPTAPIFPSPDPTLCIQTAAHEVKDGVRNLWAHCDFTRWTDAFFNDCLTKLEALVKSVGLAGDVEKIALDQLSDWKTKGGFLCMGHAVDQDLLSLFQQLVVDLMKTYRLTVRKSLAGKKRELSEIQQAVASLQNQQKSLESRAVNEGQDEVTQLQKEDLTRILERLESLEKSLGGEIRNKIRRLEQESVRGNQKLQELEKRRVETDGKVQQLENDIYLKTIADAHHVNDFKLKTCRTKLADHYKRTARVPTSVWSSKTHVTIHDIYTRLTWVRKIHNATGPSQTKLEHYTDVLKETKTGVLPKRILVQGNAGIGKSTFVKKLAVDWAELDTTDPHTEALRKYELLVVVKLREISHCGSVREIIRCSHILPNDAPALTDCLLNFVFKNQEKVLFVLDGYDEYSDGRESVIFEIFQRDQLRDCCVLMTSRPSQAEDLQEFADVHAEITGFCEEDILKFMRTMLGGEKEAHDLQSCLRKKEVFNTASTPLLLLFYCILWKKGKHESFRGTRTELYLSIVQCLLDYGHGRSPAGSRRKVDDYKEMLADLGKVALEALLKDDLVFEYGKLSESVQCEASRIIGLLEVTEYTENATPAGQVSFIHNTIQEFLAAWYITHRCIPAGNLGPVERSAQTFNECLVLENVLRFICGLSDDGAEKVFEHLKSVRMSDPTVDLSKRIGLPGIGQQARYEGTYKEERFSGFVYELFREAHLKEKLLKHCFECTEGIVLLSDLVCEYLGQLQHVTRVTDSGLFVLPRSRDVRQPQVFPDCLNVPMSCHATDSGNLKVRDFLIKFQKIPCEWCFFRSILWLRENSMKFYMTDLRLCCDSHASLICETFGCRLSCVEFLREFECLVPLNEKTMEGLGEIVGQSRYLTKIEVSGDNAICNFLSQLQLNTATRNCSFYFKWITLSSPGAETLASLLPRLKNISAVRFGLRGCSGASCRSLIGGITHGTLRELSLWTAELNPETALALCRSLSEMSMLEELSLVGEDKVIENGEVDILFGELETVLSLRILEFSRYLVGGKGIAALSGTLRRFPALQELHLHRVGICERDTRVLAQSFGNTPNLEVLSLSCNPLGRGVQYVMFALTILPKLRLLNLERTDSSEEDMTYFQEVVDALPEPSLEHLNLSCNRLGPGVKAVMALIPKLPKLRALYLRSTGCSAKDMSFLCEAVNIEPSLNVEYLNFSSNPISKDVGFVTSLIYRLPKLCRLYLDDTGCSEEDVMRCIREMPSVLLEKSFRITGKTDSPPGDWLKGGVVIRI